MPLDEYKTQVLLLHSEQSTLDNLSSGFGDRYTVHCATSGSEALNTLGETPINVIITAHDLPGMSGLDALREAKKRSPDTIGILLAGQSTKDIHALVGDEEVFQVVSGNISGDGLLQLVDNATRQMRLMALAESANDTTAGVDEPSEHIIMETSENGSAIISDGTGRLPVLDPKKVSAAASVGSRAVDVLVLTKDQEFLETIKDSSRGMHDVHYANTLAQANEALRKHNIGVAVVDAAMVGEKVEQLTQHLKKNSPRLVSIVAGRRDDGEMLMDLINRGKVYRFLLKPVSPGRARLAVESSVKHHLEAPDTVLSMPGQAAAPKTAPAAKAPPQPAPKAAPAKPAAAAPKPQPAKQATRPQADPPLGVDLPDSNHSPIEDGLSSAFGDDDSSFTETVTGLISNVTNRFTKRNKPEAEPAAPVARPEPVEKAAPTKPAATLKNVAAAKKVEPVEKAAPVKPVVPIEKPPAAANSQNALPPLDRFADSMGSDDALLRNPKVMGIGAAAVVVLAVVVFWLMSGPDTGSGPVDNTAALQQGPATPEAQELLREARLARDAGQIFNPVGSSAIDLFAAALAIEPSNNLLSVELDATVGEALRMAEEAMLAERLDDAQAALERVAAVDATNARLPFLTTQLQQIQLRSRLEMARVAIREKRYEDAGNALAAARAMDVEDRSAISAVTRELNAARSAERAEDVLAQAASKMAAGELLSPPNDNARYYYRLVLTNDPDNAAARQGLRTIAAQLASRARTAMDSGDLKSAEDMLADARALDPANADVSDMLSALAMARLAAAQREIGAAAERDRLAEQQAEAERNAQAEREANARRQAAADEAAARLAAEAAAEKAEAETFAAPANTSDADTGSAQAQPESIADDSVSTPPPAVATTPKQAEPEPAAAAPQEAAEQQPLAVSALNRTKYVAPKYPRSAQRRNLSGWVDVVFTVSLTGEVSEVVVRDASPDDTFVNAAVKAVEKWEFEPVMENGVPVAKRAGVRMMFALE